MTLSSNGAKRVRICISAYPHILTSRMRSKAIICWSGGKDSAMALWVVQREKQLDVRGLLTTISLPYERISMHGVRRELLEAQAAETGLPLFTAEVSEKTNDAYETAMLEVFAKLKSEGVTHVVFGDIFLEDLRAYREQLLAKAGLTGVFPLWKENTAALARRFIASGFRTITCCVNDALLIESWCGKEFDEKFLSELPGTVDPCGENGEFHTFCFSGPVFKNDVAFSKGETVYRPLELKTSDEVVSTKGFWYCDLVKK
jgi:uncharacterized protein (TIGR00290 family)